MENRRTKIKRRQCIFSEIMATVADDEEGKGHDDANLASFDEDKNTFTRGDE